MKTKYGNWDIVEVLLSLTYGISFTKTTIISMFHLLNLLDKTKIVLVLVCNNFTCGILKSKKLVRIVKECVLRPVQDGWQSLRHPQTFL